MMEEKMEEQMGEAAEATETPVEQTTEILILKGIHQLQQLTGCLRPLQNIIGARHSGTAHIYHGNVLIPMHGGNVKRRAHRLCGRAFRINRAQHRDGR